MKHVFLAVLISITLFAAPAFADKQGTEQIVVPATDQIVVPIEQRFREWLRGFLWT